MWRARVLDNCNTQPHIFKLCLGNVSVLSLPPTLMPRIQPVDQGVTQNIKCYYQQDVRCRFVYHKGAVDDFKSTYIFKDVVFYVADL
jgi:hypothetical protein